MTAASLRGEGRFGRAIGRLDWVRHDYMQTKRVEVQEVERWNFEIGLAATWTRWVSG